MSEPIASRTPPSSSILRSAGAMAIGTALSRILGLVRIQVFAVFFGATAAMDAFNIAFRIPNLLRDLFAEGAMNSALVPTFIRARKTEGDRRAWRVAGLVFRVLTIGLGFLCLLAWIGAEPLVGHYADAYRDTPGKFELTVTLTKIMLPFFPLVAVAAAVMGVLNACGKFFIPAFSTALFNLVSVFFGIILAQILPLLGRHPIEGMAWGVVLGGLAQVLTQMPSLYKSGYKFSAPLNDEEKCSKDHYLREMFFLMLPGIVGTAATQINILVNSVLATSEGPGAVSWLSYAFRLMQFPIGIFGVSLAAATLPKASEHWVEKSFGDFSKLTERSLLQVFAVNIPAAAGLIFLGVPVTSFLFEYGQFSAFDSEKTAQALAAYAVGLVFYSGVKVLVPVCYAMKATFQAVTCSVLTVVLTIGLSYWWIGKWGFASLALATSAGAAFNFLGLLWVTKSQSPLLSLRRLAGRFLIYSSLGIVMGVLVHATYRFFWNRWMLEDDLTWIKVLKRGVLVSIFMGEGIGFMSLACYFLKLDEAVEIYGLFLGKLRKICARIKMKA